MMRDTKSVAEATDCENVRNGIGHLTVESFETFRGNLSVDGRTFNRKAVNPARHINGEWRLQQGQYLLNFNEAFEPRDGEVGFIVPSYNTVAVGAAATPRFVTGDAMWTLFNAYNSVDIKDDSTVASIVIFSYKAEERLYEAMNDRIDSLRDE